MFTNVIYYLTALNVLTLLVYMDDKINAKLDKRRTSERTLLMLSAAGGSVGALISIFIGRHKSQHPRLRSRHVFMSRSHCLADCKIRQLKRKDKTIKTKRLCEKSRNARQ